jgi:hypothetical protein
MPEGEGKPPALSAEKRPQIEESGFKLLFARLRKRRIIETLAAFIGGGWLLLEFVHWILADHYHFPEKTIDITFVRIPGKPATDSGLNRPPVGAKRRWVFIIVRCGRIESRIFAFSSILR